MKALLSATTFTAKIAIVAAAALGGTALVSSSVFATLTATANNTVAQSVQTGTLVLGQNFSTLASGSVPTSSNGFTTSILGMAPGDTVNRFIDLSNTGNLDATLPTLSLGVAATATPLTTDPTNGLFITVQNCTVAWTSTTATAPACTGGSATSVLAATPASTLAGTAVAGVQPGAPTTITLPGTVLTVALRTTAHLLITLTLPSSEVITNGTSNLGTAGNGTVLGRTALLTWNFSESLRTNTITNS